MKKGIFKISALIIVLIMAFSLASCSIEEVFGGATSENKGEMTLVVIGDTEREYKVDLSKVQVEKGLVSVLDHLKKTEGLTYEMSGTFINDVNGIVKNGPEGAYAAIYTNVSADFDVTVFATSTVYNGKTLTSAGVGALDMHIKDGALVVIKAAVWEG